jgi:hypothetical protein
MGLYWNSRIIESTIHIVYTFAKRPEFLEKIKGKSLLGKNTGKCRQAPGQGIMVDGACPRKSVFRSDPFFFGSGYGQEKRWIGFSTQMVNCSFSYFMGLIEDHLKRILRLLIDVWRLLDVPSGFQAKSPKI